MGHRSRGDREIEEDEEVGEPEAATYGRRIVDRLLDRFEVLRLDFLVTRSAVAGLLKSES